MDELCHASAANRPESQSQLSVSGISVDSTTEALGSRSVALQPPAPAMERDRHRDGLELVLSVIPEMQENAASMQAGSAEQRWMHFRSFSEACYGGHDQN
jgi:hypothetical protein